MKYFILVLCIVCASTACADMNPTEYYLDVVIVDVDYTQDLVFCVDINGEMWAFYGAEQWVINDTATLIMDTQDTAAIEDDIIITIISF